MNKLLFFILIMLYASCKYSTSIVEVGKVYKNYKNHGAQYINDSLDFSMSYYGGCKFKHNPSKTDLEVLHVPSAVLQSKRNQIFLMQESTLDTKNSGFMSISKKAANENYSDNVLAFVKRKYEVDSVELLKNVKLEKLKNYKINKLSYLINFDNKQNAVIEYHIKWYKNKMLRLVFVRQESKLNEQLMRLASYDANYSIVSFQDSLKTKQIKNYKNLYFYVQNSFRDYNFNYLNTVKIIESLEKENHVSEDQKTLFLNNKAYFLSFVGDYKNMLHCRDVEVDNSVWSREDSTKIEAYQAFDAKESILKETKKYQVVMFNENHLNPYTRVFVKDMLDSLWYQGFRYIGLEALANFNDKNISQGRFPLQKLGSYTSEPSMANLIRTASNMGFTVFPYEYNSPSDSTDRISKRNHREKSQALNIIKILEKDPNAKIIIHAGHDHIQKLSANKKSFMMANYFKLLTKINPLCIEQATMNESFEEKMEHPEYLQIMKKYKPLKSIVLKQDNKYWVQSDKQDYHDICVFHPRTIYENNYPSWLLHSTGTKQYDLKVDSVNLENTIMQVFLKKEFDQDYPNITPLINRITNEKQTLFTLYLNSGEYVVLFSDRYRNTLFKKTLKVE